MKEESKNDKIAENIFETIGNTPLVKLEKLPELDERNGSILGKLEMFNPTGSLKDRIYYKMITEAMERGELEPGMSIIEASTGNAGIACSFTGNLLGFDVTIVMPEGMSEERQKIMEAYGANLLFTPGGESDVDLALEKVQEMKDENPGQYWEPGQFENEDNLLAHYETTGPEIWDQTDGDLDAFVATQGTGGTISGIGRFLKEKDSSIKLYAGEPEEAPLLSERQWGSHRIEGIGDGFVPRNLDLSILDGIITSRSQESIEMAQRLSREEGLFCGISSGANVVACLKLMEEHEDFDRIVTMINDSGERYYSTPLCGVEKELDVPDREHPMDEYTIKQLDKYQEDWEIIR